MKFVFRFFMVGAILSIASVASAQDWVGYSYLAGWNAEPAEAVDRGYAPVAYQTPAATPVAYTLGGNKNGCGCQSACNSGCASQANHCGCASACNSCCGAGGAVGYGGGGMGSGGGGGNGPGIFDAGIGGVAYAPGSALAAAGGYIDSAIVRSFFRLRYDAAYDGTFPDRALFNYPRADALGGILLGGGERSVDYQDISAYLELALTDRLSGFIEVPFRFLNPEDNPNTSGVMDLQTGFRYALIADCDRFTTFQLKIYAPNGPFARGIGTGHVSIEPGLLYHNRIAPRWRVDAELKLWIPISDEQAELVPGSGEFVDYAGPVVRYGLGAGYDLWQDKCDDQRRLTGVAEFVGWTVIDGLKSDPDGVVLDATGDTIVNGKFGLRWVSGQHTFYGGYAKSLTGHVWYEDMIRAEYGYAF